LTRSERTVARIAVDLLGGDGAPAVVVDGALHALHDDPALRLLLVGPREALDRAFELAAGGTAGGAEVADRLSRLGRLDCDTNGAATRCAGGAVRAAVRAVRDGLADAVVSAGPTAASVASAVSGFGRLPGVSRPALAVVIPAAAGPVILLDVGACPDVDVDDLLHHAVLGAGYATASSGSGRAAPAAVTGHPAGRVGGPRVGLLSIGTERGKGDRLRRDAADRLAASRLPGGARYVGMVEGHHVAVGGPADVVVTDGFTGNVLLKGLEGAVGLTLAARPAGSTGSPDTRAVRAALMLGVAGAFVVCHEAASAADLASGIGLAREAAGADVPARVARVHHAFTQDQQNDAGADTPVRTPGGVRP
jgi:glycerol-3-phosphate acyltransferase PlsX